MQMPLLPPDLAKGRALPLLPSEAVDASPPTGSSEGAGCDHYSYRLRQAIQAAARDEREKREERERERERRVRQIRSRGLERKR
jgi:hypothetical protein